ICFIFPHIGFAGFPLIEFSLLNRTFVLPFLLIAVDQYINKKYYISFIILGLMYNLHVISVNFVLAMFFLDILFRIKTIGVKKIIIMFLLFLLTALPVLVWKFAGEGLDFSVNRQWFDIVSKGFLFHLFNLFSSNLMLNTLTFSALSLIILFVITIKKQKLTEINQIIIHFVLAASGVIMAVFFTSNLGIYPATIIIQSQILRIGIFILLFAYLYCINDVVISYQSKKIKTISFIFLITAILFFISPVMSLIAYLIHKYLSKKLTRIFIIINIIIFVISLIIGNIINVWQPGINIFYRKDKQTDVQIWILRNTPKDTVLITPPYTWWFYNVEWRVLTERSNLVSLSDLLEVAFSPRHIKWWKPRFEDIAPGALSQFKDNVFDNIMITKEAYYKLKTEDFLRIAKKYNASYLVVETAYKYNFSIVYKNEEFTVYKINPL
ncbi:MAG: hypothetical protein Q7R95_10940, partial [bacterium]|nr:hypothetical protein [bacterium]